MKAKQIRSLLTGIIIFNTTFSAGFAAQESPVEKGTSGQAKKAYDKAEDAWNRQELGQAFDLYRKAAELNSTDAQVQMGNMAESGDFQEEAVGWYLMAASQGNANGQYDLARMYAAGSGIEKDMSKALYWFKRAAAQNHVSALKIVADAYKKGWGGLVEVNLDQAKALESKAAHLEAIERKETDKKMSEYAEARRKLLKEKADKQAEASKKANK